MPKVHGGRFTRLTVGERAVACTVAFSRMKILFSATHFGFLRHFESTLRLLAERGHQIHLVGDRRDQTEGQRMVESLQRAYPDSITYEILPLAKQWLWYPLGTALRTSLDYWRYLRPDYHQASGLRSRAERQAPPPAVWLARLPVVGSSPARRLYASVIRSAERALTIRPEVRDLIERHRPDLLVVTPLLYFGSQQSDYVRAAKAVGVPSVLCVGSWDHLTTKGLIHEVPDRVVVWNEAQREEAARFHGVPRDRVIVTGAQAYDHWFSAKPSTSRTEFAARVGLPAEQPFLLYLCSSPFIAPHEVPFVKRWLSAVRSTAHDTLRAIPVLVRPHPQNSEQWRDVDLREFGDVAIWPRGGANPVDAAARADYYDSMFHSLAVVGVNTSALIESGIVGRMVFSVAADEFAATQEGTLHFQHLKSVNGGLLHLATSLEEHTAQLIDLLNDIPGKAHPPRAFIEGFIRPHGLDVPATPKVVEALEQLGESGRGVPAKTPGGAVWRLVLAPIAGAMLLASAEPDRRRAIVRQWTSRGAKPRRVSEPVARSK